MRFAAGLTVTGILGFLLLEALKIVLIPVSQWLIGALAALFAILLKAALIGLVVVLVAVVGAVLLWLYRRQQRAAEEV